MNKGGDMSGQHVLSTCGTLNTFLGALLFYDLVLNMLFLFIFQKSKLIQSIIRVVRISC